MWQLAVIVYIYIYLYIYIMIGHGSHFVIQDGRHIYIYIYTDQNTDNMFVFLENVSRVLKHPCNDHCPNCVQNCNLVTYPNERYIKRIQLSKQCSVAHS